MRELGNLAREIRGRVSMQDVALRYTAARPGKYIVCPFHAEKTPSMRIYDDSFHCFGCGAHGDVTDFVKGVLGISAMQAVEQVNADFGLNLPIGRKMTLREKAVSNRRKRINMRNKQNAQAEVNGAEDAYFAALDHWLLLDGYLSEYAPTTPDEAWHPLFVQALQGHTLALHKLEEAEERRCMLRWKQGERSN